jgi:5-formyltetrahydrofolate cyclo-ligase
MREVRAAIDTGRRRELARIVEDSVAAVDAVRRARTVLIFYSFGSEIPTRGLIARLSREGKRILLPYLDEERRMEAAVVEPGEVPVPAGYGPKEPARRVPVDPAEVDVVIAPGLAFDRLGYRLGYGGGHYDRYLRRLGPEAVRIGIGFSVQLVDEVPAGPGDQLLDLVVTDQGIVERSRQEG